MGEIINLRLARKKKARARSGAEAAEKRAKFGLSRAEREATTLAANLGAARLDGHLRTVAAPDAPDDDRG